MGAESLGLWKSVDALTKVKGFPHQRHPGGGRVHTASATGTACLTGAQAPERLVMARAIAEAFVVSTVQALCILPAGNIIAKEAHGDVEDRYLLADVASSTLCAAPLDHFAAASTVDAGSTA